MPQAIHCSAERWAGKLFRSAKAANSAIIAPGPQPYICQIFERFIVLFKTFQASSTVPLEAFRSIVRCHKSPDKSFSQVFNIGISYVGSLNLGTKSVLRNPKTSCISFPLMEVSSDFELFQYSFVQWFHFLPAMRPEIALARFLFRHPQLLPFHLHRDKESYFLAMQWYRYGCQAVEGQEL